MREGDMAINRRALALVLSLVGVAVIISISGVLLLYFAMGRQPSVPREATLTLRLGGELAEVESTNVLGYLTAEEPTVRGVVENLLKAKVDDRIQGVFIKVTGFTSPYWGKIQEVRDAILDFRASGKPVHAYLEYATDQDYYLATAADKIVLMPSSPLNLTGVATYELFLRGTLDKVGAYPDLHHVGAYKTAVNTFTEKSLTDTHREMNESLNRDLYEQIVNGIAEGRKKQPSDVKALIDKGPLLPEAAFEAQLVDDVLYEDEARDQLREETDTDEDSNVEEEDYARVSGSIGLGRGPRIALIYAVGAIVGGASGFDPLNGAAVGSDTLIDYIERAQRDESIRAIVLRIDSPGGSATASDAIWRELVRAKGDGAVPLVASMSDLAASGGYYIAMAADAIVAQPSTLTGSIGIYGGKFVTGGVYAKLGANIESSSIGRHAEMNSPARPYNAEEAKKLQEQLQAFYDQFVEKAADARGMAPSELDRLAQGRVWTGHQAKANGLVDELGGLMKAIAIAKERAGIASDRDIDLVVYPPRRSVYELLSERIAGGGFSVGSWMAAQLSSAEIDALRVLRGPFGLFRRGEALALLPFAFVR
jgi:protease-4